MPSRTYRIKTEDKGAETYLYPKRDKALRKVRTLIRQGRTFVIFDHLTDDPLSLEDFMREVGG